MNKTFTLSGFILFLNILFSGLLVAQSIGDYRSAASGAWNVPATWSTWNGSAWAVAATSPSTTSGIITIQASHSVSITASVSVDQVVVNSGATLVSTGGTLTIGNGTLTGVQLQVDGTFWDANGTSVAFATAATWQLGATGTFIKNSASAIAIWHSSYQGGGGMAAIPATSNWIVRRSAAAIPSFSNVGVSYGNLTIENTNATTLNITAAGSSGFMTIKGNLDIGGAGTTGVIMNNTNTNVTPTQVQGNMLVRASRTYTGSGTGINVAGTLTVNGTFNNNTAGVTTIQGASTIVGTFNNNGTSTANLQGGTNVNGAFTNTATATANLRGTTNINNTYSNIGITNVQGDLQANGNLTYTGATSQLNFTGGNSQTVAGVGTLQLRNSTINKTANDVAFNRPITIDNVLTLTQGKVFTTATNLLTIGNSGTVVVTSPSTNNSFVSGPIRKDNTAAGFTFPVGKGSNYQPLTIDATAGSSAGTFWTEDFNTGAVGWTLNVPTGAEGADANFWQVTANEGGVLPPGCGVTNNGNPTLHVTSVFNPTGGAAYDAGGGCGFLFCPQADRRTESPVINCTGHSNISLKFNYIENGSGVLDNADVWYSSGGAFVLLEDMPKTPIGCSGQGIWTQRVIALPASADNNPNVRIAFHWQNNDDGVGTDPSFAVDDVSLLESAPVESFTAEYFPANPQTTFGTAKDASILDITTSEYWILDRNAGTVSKNVTLSWDKSSLITTPSSTQVIRWDGSQWRDHTNGGTTGVSSSDPTCATQSVCGTLVSGTIVSNFSPFTFGVPIGSLPLELLDFTAQLEERRVNLRWTTTTETNTSRFVVEKSQNAVDFQEIGEVPAAGNSTQMNYYQSYDNTLQTGVTYYRLKMIDLDGSFTYSKIASIDYRVAQQNIQLFPNPTKSKLYLTAPNLAFEILDVKIIDVMGRVLESKTLQYDNNTYEISMEHLPVGTYFVQFIYQNQAFIEKIIKQ